MKVCQIITGSMRPRHKRFQLALKQLCETKNISLEQVVFDKIMRAKLHFKIRRLGYRCTNVSSMQDNSLYIMHQSLCNADNVPYIAEFDLPMGLHNYVIKYHRKSYHQARAYMEKDNLKKILVFSDWAKRSFALHYGKIVGDKCCTLYPISCLNKLNLKEDRKYDFCFISTQFRIKAGPEFVRAFKVVYERFLGIPKCCVITNLKEAQELVGSLHNYPGIDWKNSDQSEEEILAVLNNSKCLVHPSLADSFGVVVLEALAAGCAIVATNFASFPEMVQDSYNGILISPPISSVSFDSLITEYGNSDYFADYLQTLSLHKLQENLVDIMHKLFDNQQLLKQMMLNSQQLFKERFDLPVWQEKINKIMFAANSAITRRN